MAIRLVKSGGSVVDAAVIDMHASGTIWPGSLVDFSRTGGTGVTPGLSTSTSTTIFGVCLDYVEGASDTSVKVIPIVPGQLWEVDCVAAALTAQVGLRHVMNDERLVRNTSTDLGAGNAATAVFRAVAMTGSTSGSGKLIGYFRKHEGVGYPSGTTFTGW